jgi:hypothetical protein
MGKKVGPMSSLEEAFKLNELFRAIGHFTFQFSQLEFTIRHALADMLNLGEELFDPITAPYDFATLCRVTKMVLQKSASADPDMCNEIDKVVRDCLRLNEQRVRIAHGTWFVGNVALHVSRGTLKASEYFKSSDDIEKQAEEAQRLMGRISEIVFGKPKPRGKPSQGSPRPR